MTVYLVVQLKDVYSDCIGEHNVIGVFSSPENAARATGKPLHEFVHVDKYKYWMWVEYDDDGTHPTTSITISEFQLDIPNS